MASPDDDGVKAILQDNYDCAKQTPLQPFIDTANAIMVSVNTCALNKGIVMPDALQTQVATWLAAHFYCINDPLYMSRTTNKASGQFQRGPAESGFGSTDYGRQAVALDYSGCLANIGLKQRAGMHWLGKPRSRQIPYCQRD